MKSLSSTITNIVLIIMEHITLKTLTLEDLKKLRGLVNKEIDSRTETICKKETKMLEKGYELYKKIVRDLGPKAATLEISGWSFGQYLKYMQTRNPSYNLSYLHEMLEEEAESRNKVWLANRKLHLSQHTPYVSLTHVYEPK